MHLDTHEILNRFEAFCLTDNLSPKTIYGNYLWSLKIFCKYVEAIGIPLTDFTYHEIMGFLHVFAGRGVTDRTINDMTRNIKMLFKFCVEFEILPSDPSLKVPYRKCEIKLEPVLTPQQIQQVLDSINVKDFYSCRLHTIISLLYDSCIRLNELTHIKTSELNFQDRLIKITHAKGRKERLVSFGKESFKSLHRWLYRYRTKYIFSDHSQYLFCSKDGKQLDSRVLQKRMHNLGRKLGIRLHPHLLRSSGATAYILNGGSVATLQTLLGHAALRMTSKYVRLSGIDIQKAHLQFSPLDNLKIK